MSKKPGPNRENFKNTSAKFLKIARAEFIEHGYLSASTERIVKESGMARGSLYYHYGNKEGIFKAVYKAVITESAKRIEKNLEHIEDPVEVLKTGCRLFFMECKRPDIRVIMLSEGMAHIPYLERLEMLEDNLLSILRSLVENVYKHGKFKEFDPAIFLTFIFGITAECGRSFEYFGKTDNVDARILSYNQNLSKLLDKLA